MAKVLLLALVGILVWGFRRVELRPRRARPRGRPPGSAGPVRPRTGGPGSADPHDVLGVTRGASRDEVRRAYHARVREFHPDRVAGAAAEIQRLAEQRTRELNAAYRALTGEDAGGRSDGRPRG